ncbi:YceD family protein [Afipia sp. TerB]
MAGKTQADRPTSAKELPWSFAVVVAQIPEDGSRVAFEADAAQRAALATVAGLREVLTATAEFDLSHGGDGTVHALGRVQARIGQTCVVTLDPIENTIDEPIDVIFAHPSDAPAPRNPAPTGEEDDLEDIPDPPEPIIGGTIDLGRVATDFLFLGIDPYPRKPDAVFEPPTVADDPEDHPFAALKALKDGPSSSSGKKGK